MAKAKPKDITAVALAKQRVKSLKRSIKANNKHLDTARGWSNGWWIIAQQGAKKKRPHAWVMKKKWDKAIKADGKRKKRLDKELDSAKNKLSTLQGYASNLNAARAKVQQHAKEIQNEGNCAIYRSDGHSSAVVFISPSDTESESASSNITSWPVDVGEPRSNHARVSSDTKTVAGIITGEDRAEANSKYAKLKWWHEHHVELTYVGDITAKHLQIQELSNTFSNLRDNLKVSITFQEVPVAEIKTSSGRKKHKKSRSSKTTRGTRNKRYTAITIKPGDTLLGLSRRYGKSVSWLQKVNGIKNPNRIIAGRSLYVSQKQKKINKKKRVR